MTAKADGTLPLIIPVIYWSLVHFYAVGSETALVVVWVWVRPINVLVNALSTLTLRFVSAVSLI